MYEQLHGIGLAIILGFLSVSIAIGIAGYSIATAIRSLKAPGRANPPEEKP